MCQEPVQYTIVALSNFVYFILAIWLYANKFHWSAFALVLVASASIFFHLDPNSDLAYFIDVVVSNIVIFFIIVHFLPHTKRGRGFVFFSFVSFSLGGFLLFQSGEDRTSARYVAMHSTWHVATALATYFLVKAYIITEPKTIEN